MRWVSDITYVRTYEGFLYVATVLDLFSRWIVGWSMDKNIDRHLVINVLLMAVWARQPTKTVLVHSDQGSQYGSVDYPIIYRKKHLQIVKLRIKIKSYRLWSLHALNHYFVL